MNYNCMLVLRNIFYTSTINELINKLNTETSIDAPLVKNMFIINVTFIENINKFNKLIIIFY